MARTFVCRLQDGPRPELLPKAQMLAVLACRSIDVPDGWVISQDTEIPSAVRAWLGDESLAVRSASPTEDTAQHSGAGLGRSVLDVTAADLTEAIATVATPQVIVQRQVAGRCLVVAAVTDLGVQVDVHDTRDRADAERLSGEHTPDYSGALAAWDHAAAPNVATTVDAAVAAATDAGYHSAHGWDLELIVADDRVWVVQLRPLTAALYPGWPAFCAAVATAQGLAVAEFGEHTLVLDAEHNPEPLSVAHQWIIERLADERGAVAGSPVVLAGWLYVASLPRDLAGRRPSTQAPLSPQAALQVLTESLLPQARARHDALVDRTGSTAHASDVAATVQAAWGAFLTMIDAYVSILIPARRAAASKDVPALVSDDPLTLRQRDRYLDVLPAIWDVASPTLAELGVQPRRVDEPASDHEIPQDPAQAAALLAEWDDHLFALGLSPLRTVYRWVGRASGLGEAVFGLRGDELADAVAGQHPDLAARQARQLAQQQLTPPLRIVAGRPAFAAASAALSGIPIGEPTSGPIAVRRDLTALLADPPPAGAIVVLPALTAPAAVVLAQAGVTAVCSEFGGPLSHAALMARELGLSALIGCRGCTALPNGQRMHLDTRAGRLRRPSPSPSGPASVE